MITIPENKLIVRIREILVPKLGKFITDSTIRVNCERLNIKPEEITASQIPILAEKIKVTLLLFLKEEEIEEITQKIVSIK